jgi:uncharacterized repeat protein (TIGR03803 family)
MAKVATITITQHLLCVGLATALCAAADPGANQGAFRVISTLPDYSQPGELLEGSPGLFYSIAQLAGTGSFAVYTVTLKGKTTTLTSFASGYNIGAVVSGPNDRFYDAVAYLSNPGNVFSVTKAPGLQEYPTQAIFPLLVQDLPNGTFLGLGSIPGSHSLVNCDQEGNVTQFYQFPSGDYIESLLYASDGNYYGVDYGAAGPYAYRVTPSGALTSLYSFPTSAFSGALGAPLVQGSDGNLYGAAPYGGANGTGTVYKLSLAGDYTLVYTFPKGPGGFPTTLIQASDGNLYGTTSGNTQEPKGHSVFFRLTTSGQYTQLYAWPYSTCPCSLTQGSDGQIYGIASPGHEYFAWDGGLAKPAPNAPQFTPASGAAGTQVLIWGYNLLSPSVKFNGVAATSVTGSGPNYVVATVPSGAATGPITVTTPGGSYTTQTSFTVQ